MNALRMHYIRHMAINNNQFATVWLRKEFFNLKKKIADVKTLFSDGPLLKLHNIFTSSYKIISSALSFNRCFLPDFLIRNEIIYDAHKYCQFIQYEISPLFRYSRSWHIRLYEEWISGWFWSQLLYWSQKMVKKLNE